MQFHFNTARADVTPSVTATGFRAQANLQRESSEGDDIGDEKIERDLGSFSTSAEAVEHARKWAIAFCHDHWF